VYSGTVFHAAGYLSNENSTSAETNSATGILSFSTVNFGTINCSTAGGTVGPEVDGYLYTVSFDPVGKILTLTSQGSNSVAGWQLTLLQGPG
jgi:hypothetical protein